MNYGALLFLGAFFAMALSWFGLVLEPHLQFGRSQPVPAVGSGDLYPQARPGLAQQGSEVYRSLGCVTCHSQQVRPATLGSDLARGWGVRRSVAADYLYEQPALTGNLRIGPDLANVGMRLPSIEWHLLHLYDPRATMEAGRKSVMPPYPFLFETRKVGRQPSRDALKLPAELAPAAGWEVVPKPEAKALAAYLVSLRNDAALFEAPLPQPPSTNAPGATATNAASVTSP